MIIEWSMGVAPLGAILHRFNFDLMSSHSQSSCCIRIRPWTVTHVGVYLSCDAVRCVPVVVYIHRTDTVIVSQHRT